MAIPSSINSRPLLVNGKFWYPQEILYGGGATGATALGSGTIVVPDNKNFDGIILANLAASQAVAFRIHFNNSGNNYSEMLIRSGELFKLAPKSFYGISGTARSSITANNPISIHTYVSQDLAGNTGLSDQDYVPV